MFKRPFSAFREFSLTALLIDTVRIKQASSNSLPVVKFKDDTTRSISMSSVAEQEAASVF